MSRWALTILASSLHFMITLLYDLVLNAVCTYQIATAAYYVLVLCVLTCRTFMLQLVHIVVHTM